MTTTTTCICIEPRRSPYLPGMDICADCHRLVPNQEERVVMTEEEADWHQGLSSHKPRAKAFPCHPRNPDWPRPVRVPARVEAPHYVAFCAVEKALAALEHPDAYPDSDALRWMMLGWIADHEGGA